MKTQNVIIIVVLVAVVFFYGGYKYGGDSSTRGQGQFAAGQNGGNRAGGARGGMRGGGNGGGFTGGEVLSKDDKSVIIKLRDGGSKIVYYATSTVIQKAAGGSIGDVVTGEQVTVTGSTNADGSISAQSIQIRPAGAPGMGGSAGR